jgi:hypothetical protein
MHFHLPKPLRGWREFVGEVGIIVLGVLIALGAEQVAEQWRWRHDVGIVRDSINGELANDRARWNLDVESSRCALDDVQRLDSWVANGANVRPPSVPSLRSSNLLSLHSANWKLATGSQTLSHFPLREQLAFAALYDALANRMNEGIKASDLIDRVHTLIPLATDEQGRRALRETLGDLRAKLTNLLDNVPYMDDHFNAVAVKADRRDIGASIHEAGCSGEGAKVG